MIIVSQDKDVIVNFHNIETIGTGNPLEDDEGKFKILVNTTIDNQYVIAKYATEERAKEVLQEIRNTFGVKSIQNCDYNTADLTMKLKHLAVYEMPED